jgi:hypothetical protein
MSVPFEQSQADDLRTDTEGRARPTHVDAVDAEAGGPVTAQLVVSSGASPTERADRAFLVSLKRVGLLEALGEAELERLLSAARAEGALRATAAHGGEAGRHLDLLERYFSAADDVAAALERARADRFVIHHASSGENAHAVLRRVVSVAPEIGRLRFERIGTDDGPLVLRLGEHVAAVDEDDEETRDSDEIDLSSLEAAAVSVRSLVRAANVLLKREGVERRFVLLRCDGRREAFCAVDIEGAMELCSQGLVEERSASRLIEFGAF